MFFQERPKPTKEEAARRRAATYQSLMAFAVFVVVLTVVPKAIGALRK